MARRSAADALTGEVISHSPWPMTSFWGQEGGGNVVSG